MHTVNDITGRIFPPPKQLRGGRAASLRKRVIAYGGVLQITLWMVFIGFCVASKSPFPVTLRGSIPNPSDDVVPFLNGEDYLNTLEQFKNATTQRNILLIYGPKSQSKTRGIKEKCWEWEHRNNGVGDICIFIDLKEWEGDILHYAELVGSTIINALRRTNLPISDSIQSIIEDHFRPDPLKKLVNKLVGFPPFKQMLDLYVPDAYTNIADALYGMVINGSVEVMVDHFEFLYKTLDDIAKDSYPRKIIFILSEVQQLSKIGQHGQEIWNRLYSDFGRKKGGDSKLVHIVETSESFFIIDEKIRENTASFTSYRINPLHHDKTKDEVVNIHQFMNEDEFEKVWSLIGGYAGAWFVVLQYFDVERGNLDIVLQDLYLFYNKLFMQAIKKPHGMKTSKIELLKQLKGNDFVYKPLNREISDAAIGLVRQNILFWDSESLTPQNGLYQSVINSYLEDLKMMNEDKEKYDHE